MSSGFVEPSKQHDQQWRSAVIKALAKAALHYRIEMTEPEFLIYLEFLPRVDLDYRTIDSDRIVAAIGYCIQELAFMPKVSEIISRIPRRRMEPEPESPRAKLHRELGEEWERLRSANAAALPDGLGKSDWRQKMLREQLSVSGGGVGSPSGSSAEARKEK